MRTPCQTFFLTFSRWFYFATPGGRHGGTWRPPPLRHVSNLAYKCIIQQAVKTSTSAVSSQCRVSPLVLAHRAIQRFRRLSKNLVADLSRERPCGAQRNPPEPARRDPPFPQTPPHRCITLPHIPPEAPAALQHPPQQRVHPCSTIFSSSHEFLRPLLHLRIRHQRLPWRAPAALQQGSTHCVDPSCNVSARTNTLQSWSTHSCNNVHQEVFHGNSHSQYPCHQMPRPGYVRRPDAEQICRDQCRLARTRHENVRRSRAFSRSVGSLFRMA